MTRTRTLVVFACAALAAGGAVRPAAAQAERYELGRRLRAFETAWEGAARPAQLKALAGLPKATTQFFGFQFGEAGRTLDAARRTLVGTEVTPPTAWAEALFVAPEARLIDAGKPGLEVVVKPFYAVKGPVPEGATCRVTLGTGEPRAVPLAKFPAKIAVPLPKVADAGQDLPLALEVLIDGRPVSRHEVTVSVVPGATKRLAALPKSAPTTIEAATLRDRVEHLTQLAEGTVSETDLPAAKLLAEAEALAKLPAGTAYFTAARGGQFWLSVPLEQPDGKFGTAPVRLFVPEKLDAARPVPLVVALHGAGGSENLFFEGYGAGHVVEECRSRGWLLVAPRAGLFGAPAVAEIVAALAERYPIDAKSVFVVGHSMGAGQAAELVQQSPGRYRAVALLGGAARVRDAKAFADLPLFLGVGTKDQLALAGTRALNKTLAAAGAKRLTYREYPEAEHLVVVREALPDLFAWWDALRAG